jgi:hypothetical protein
MSKDSLPQPVYCRSLLLAKPVGAGSQRLHGQVSAAVANWQPTGLLTGTNRLNRAIGLPLRNQESLTNLFRQIYDPASANFRHLLKLKP